MGLNETESKVLASCDVHIQSRCSNFQTNAHCLIIPKIIKDLPKEIDRSKLQLPNNIELADVEFHKISPVDMLIGAEFFFDLLDTGKIQLDNKQLVLQNTKLGWIVAGTMSSIISKNSRYKIRYNKFVSLFTDIM